MDLRKNCGDSRDEDGERILPETENRDVDETYFRWWDKW
jgi:hypothetical protein